MSGPNVLTTTENIDEVTMDETFGPGIEGVCLYVPLWTLRFKLELRLRVEEISEHFPEGGFQFDTVQIVQLPHGI